MSRHVFIVTSLLASVIASAQQPPASSARAAKPAAQKTAPERAWDDLRWLMTALEAYSTDNDSLYAPAGAAHEGKVSDLDQQLELYYANTFPKKAAAPRVDPWGREYRFVISDTRKSYALYSLGAKGKLDDASASFLKRLKNDQVSPEELEKARPSSNIVASGGLVLAPEEVLQGIKPASDK
jgi:Type II secretion system (T2SS), protein G